MAEGYGEPSQMLRTNGWPLKLNDSAAPYTLRNLSRATFLTIYM